MKTHLLLISVVLFAGACKHAADAPESQPSPSPSPSSSPETFTLDGNWRLDSMIMGSYTLRTVELRNAKQGETDFTPTEITGLGNYNLSATSRYSWFDSEHTKLKHNNVNYMPVLKANSSVYFAFSQERFGGKSWKLVGNDQVDLIQEYTDRYPSVLHCKMENLEPGGNRILIESPQYLSLDCYYRNPCDHDFSDQICSISAMKVKVYLTRLN